MLTFEQRTGDWKSQFLVKLNDEPIGAVSISENPTFEPWREFRWVGIEVMQEIADFMKKLAQDTSKVCKERKTEEVLVPGWYWVRENPGAEEIRQVILTSQGAHPQHKPRLRLIDGRPIDGFTQATWFGPLYHPFSPK